MAASYTILGRIAKGGMASVYLGRMTASAGFTRIVAIKRLHPELASDNEFVAMLVDEARLAGRIRHPNVIDTLDLFADDGAFSLVLEYIEGDALSALTKQARMAGEPIVPLGVALAIVVGALRGLHAAHEARGEDGTPLGIVHRDVSPQNILVGVDGVPRVIDFGIAKASGRMMTTRPGEVRGKFSYMAPEQLLGRPVTRLGDVYAAGVVLWELLTGTRLFTGDDARAVCAAVLRGEIARPSSVMPSVSPELDAIVARATARDVADRYLTASDMLADLEKLERASDGEVGAWTRPWAAQRLSERQQLIEAAPSSRSSLVDVMNDLARSSSDPALPPAPSSSAPVLGAPSPEPSSSTLPLPFSGPVRPAPSPSWVKAPVLLVGIAAVLVLGVVGTVVGARTGRARVTEATAAQSLPAATSALASATAPPVETAPPPPDPPTDPAPPVETAPEIVPAVASAAPPAPVKASRPPPKRRKRAPSPSATIDPRAYP
jgi:eukaryotic-like serine/threonine-protein kinase